MSRDIVRRKTPEEAELERKRAQLAALEATLAQRELELATLQAELHAFEQRYLRVVGVRYAELDALEARITEALAQQHPADVQAQARAEAARAQARASAEATADVPKAEPRPRFTPSESLRRLYREVAKRLHPDLAIDERERVRRTRLMAEANRAYAAGDEERLQQLLDQAESSPEAVPGEGIGAELVRVIRKIAQVEERLVRITGEIAALKASELWELKAKADQAEAQGRDVLAEMAATLDTQIAQARQRLEQITAGRRRA